MTDQELDHVKDLFDQWLSKQDNLCEVSIHESLGNAFFDGYEQGQNFQREVFADNCKRCSNKRNKLEQENAELKAELENLKEELRLTEKELSINIINSHHKDKIITELKEEVEKMKCCENCKFWIDNDCTIDHDYDCKRWNNHNTDDYWECVK